ncbi:MAG: hypothetical protein B1H13_00795 [Desulfobacteraceae bacterium 4484_190.3]|nr:MAG: hypothetical protein B1H13_00795 [Desulfobacteraceae bacterium 4484_190.3]
MIFVNYIRCKVVLAKLAIMILLFFPAYSAAGTNDMNNRLLTESGIITGYGTGDVEEGNYEPVLLIWHLGCDLKRFIPELKNYSGTFSVYLEPQINPVFERETDLEFGVGVGLKYLHPVTEEISAYIFGSVGPHYITVQTTDQANGFIFSDTIGAGFSFFLTEKSSLNLGYRFRHMSNAGIKKPNGGINTHFGTIGYSVYF